METKDLKMTRLDCAKEAVLHIKARLADIMHDREWPYLLSDHIEAIKDEVEDLLSMIEEYDE